MSLLLLIFLFTSTVQAQEPYHFACDLYHQLATAERSKNICFSPFSVQTGIEMAYEGAQGTTAQEIAQVLHLQKDSSQRLSAKKELLDLLNAHNPHYTLTCTNDVWIQKGFNVKKRYSLEILQDFYNTQNKIIDFAKDPRAAEQTINAAVSKQTQGYIPEILSAGVLNDLTRLVLTNAIYFKGAWEKPFDVKNTVDAPFWVDAKTSVTVPLMHLPNDKFLYTQTDNLQILELEYAGNALSMLILLPKEKTLTRLEHDLTPENLTAWKEDLAYQTINLFLPRFKFGTAYTLNDMLTDLGMKDAFTAKADFSGIDGKRDLYISLVAHQATLDVNEQGTVATAATAVVMNMKSFLPQPAIEFRADHPFIFLIQEKSTGTVLFMGRVVRPVIF